MKTEHLKFSGSGSTTLPGILWLPEGTPHIVLQVTHGMTEHIGRYTALAEKLTACGIAVAGFDLRGHGENPGDPDCASFGEGGWEASLEDMRLFFNYLDQRFPGIPHYMLGFSLGSFLLREYLHCYDDKIAGAVIMGTAHQPKALLNMMISTVKKQVEQAGFDCTTPLVQKLSFETYNKKFAPNRTPSDWLCSDNAQLDAYLADSLCRANISSGLFLQLLESIKRTGSVKACTYRDKNMPVLLLSGTDDPVGNFGKGVPSVKRLIKKAGTKSITVHLLDGARHDVLHEESNGCASQARQILTDWILNNNKV